MATKKTTDELSIVTGMETATNKRDAEFDLVSALLSAAEYKTDDDNITEVEIKRRGKYLFSVHIHPISDSDVKAARKYATTFMPNPQNKKLPPIEKETDDAKFASWLIYLATTADDQRNIWGNPEILKKFGLRQPWESVDVLLTTGEKRALLNQVFEVSGLNDDDEYVDQETFLDEPVQ